MSLNILQNFKKGCLHTEPYPHIVIKNCLPDDLYAELNSVFPMECGGYPEPPSISKLWNEFLCYHRRLDFFYEMLNAFGETIEVCPAFNFLDNEKKLKSDVEIISTTPGDSLTNAITLPHLDDNKKLYVGNLYFRPEEDSFLGGEFIVYKADNSSEIVVERRAGMPIKSSVKIKEVKRVKYEANTLCVFANAGASIHAVTKRSGHIGRMAVKFQGRVNRKFK